MKSASLSITQKRLSFLVLMFLSCIQISLVVSGNTNLLVGGSITVPSTSRQSAIVDVNKKNSYKLAYWEADGV